MTHPSQRWRVGVDTGGTFTDLVLSGSEGAVTAKTLSTPENPAAAIFAGLQQLVERASLLWPHRRAELEGQEWWGSVDVVHGSTVATNALLEGKHGSTALITTAGFEDVLQLARQNRPSLYQLAVKRPAPPIPRALIFGVQERILFDGSVQDPLTEDALSEVLRQLQNAAVESVAICLLHAYANPCHEQRLARHIRAALPAVHLTVSHELMPEFREYERTSTCVVNALVAPPMSRYLQRLRAGLQGGLRIMASNGGTSSVEAVCAHPVQTILSGPAGGARATEGWSKLEGCVSLIALDMGGTSTDCALCEGSVPLSSETVIGHFPVRLPMMAIHTVGAGGGSIAWLDRGGALRVGPQSAGAAPGPAAYGRQSEPWLPTVTDAHVVLGKLPGEVRLGGRLPLDRAAAHAAVASLATPLGLSVEATAEGILRVADATMVRAIQKITVHQGRDPRESSLLPFGGAGGLHACRLANQLGIREILLPPLHGMLSAVGMLMACPSWSSSQALMLRVKDDEEESLLKNPRVSGAMEELERQLRDKVREEGFDWTEITTTTSLDLRFVGQSYELTVPLSEKPALQRFKERHRTLYGSLPTGREIELVCLRMDARAPSREFAPAPQRASEPTLSLSTAAVFHEQRWEEWPLVERTSLCPGQPIAGPGLLLEENATTVIEPGWTGRCLDSGAILLTKEGRG